ncbi:hypothetical protein RUM43_002077 [Polyplax serrata]|uniref:Spermatogenesis-associated protein 1 C-terminal domain-containing protein n=1 Tax=Polyplax serrata TaxID=468196 RepID=A0AAN8S2G1_POLSC
MTDRKDSGSDWRVPIPSKDSATLKMSTNLQKISLLSALNEVLKERRSLEHRRNSLLQSAVLRQHLLEETKDQYDSGWQEKINEALEIGDNCEKQCAMLRDRRDQLHKELIVTIDRTTSHRILHNIPSLRANYKIQACQLQRDIADLKRRVNNAKFRLDAEKKIANSLSNTVKDLRMEASTKKFSSMSIRPRTLAILSHQSHCKSTRENSRLRNAARFTTFVNSWKH